ncbi:MAG: hypothetical protein KAT66_05705 [Candidatus Lokiarchaeota archaeon]|nr:hypothetical protein [Candidatus Lokiarchaeota archaeon]
MAEFFNSSSDKNPFEELAIVYVLYFDEAQGHVPLLIYPDDRYKDDKKFMRPIKYHPIWFLSLDEQEVLDHIDLEFKGYTFFGKKFLTISKRKKRRAGLEEETPETIVVIVSLPTKLEILGDELIKQLTIEIKGNFEKNLFEIIESEIVRDAVIKSLKVEKLIEKGDKIKNELRELIEKIVNKYFSRAIKQADTTSIKMQKAISYLALKGIDVSHISSGDYKGSFSSIKLFDPAEISEIDFANKSQFSIIKVNIMEDSQEFEILTQNDSKNEFHNLSIKITNVKEYFEKEIMSEHIDIWFPEEELVFVSPIIPHIDEYIFCILGEKTKERLISKRIDLNILRNQKN